MADSLPERDGVPRDFPISLLSSTFLFLSHSLPFSSLCLFSVPVKVLLPSCFVSGTILDSYGAQSKLPMNINAEAKSSQLTVAHWHFRSAFRGSQWPIVLLFNEAIFTFRRNASLKYFFIPLNRFIGLEQYPCTALHCIVKKKTLLL